MAKRDMNYIDLMTKYYFTDYMEQENLSEDEIHKTRGLEVTFQVTENCNLCCSYCYQHHKNTGMMTTEVADKILDWLFQEWDKNDPNSIVNQTKNALVFDFIGGEPFLNIDIITYICDNFVKRCVKLHHPWLQKWRISVTSNGTLYFDKKVQDFLNKYHDFLALTVTIDGPKEIHDLCRVDKNHNGSFDIVSAAMRDYNSKLSEEDDKYTKITIAKENLSQLDTIIDFLFEENFTNVQANCVYEGDWDLEDAKLFYNKLKIMADKLLASEKNIKLWLFEEDYFVPMKEEDNDNWCGGTGLMIAFDPWGVAYPCLRYMRTSLGPNVAPITIGNIHDGIYVTEKDKETKKHLESITRKSQSTEECFNCPIARGCGWCSAWNYQCTGNINCRCTNICVMHKARSLANVYYWNLYYRKHNLNNRKIMYLNKEEALKIIDEQEYNMLLSLTEE